MGSIAQPKSRGTISKDKLTMKSPGWNDEMWFFNASCLIFPKMFGGVSPNFWRNLKNRSRMSLVHQGIRRNGVSAKGLAEPPYWRGLGGTGIGFNPARAARAFPGPTRWQPYRRGKSG